MFDNTNYYALRKEIIAGFTHYYVSFEDSTGVEQEIEVPRTVYLEFLHFVRRERTLRRRDERHMEQSTLTPETLHQRAVNVPESIEDAICNNLRDERLRQALGELPDIQRRRFILHYEYGLTYQRIAGMDGCTKMAIKFSVDLAKQKIRDQIKKF